MDAEVEVNRCFLHRQRDAGLDEIFVGIESDEEPKVLQAAIHPEVWQCRHGGR